MSKRNPVRAHAEERSVLVAGLCQIAGYSRQRARALYAATEKQRTARARDDRRIAEREAKGLRPLAHLVA